MPAYTPVDIPVNLPASPSLDHLVEEVAVAININGINHAVMMVTPDDLTTLPSAFCLARDHPAQPRGPRHPDWAYRAGDGAGCDHRQPLPAALTQHKRRLTGATGCGICGVAAVEQALPALSVLPLTPPLDGALLAGLRPQIAQWQLKGQQHGALHAALALDAEGGSCTAGKISGATMPSTS